MKRAALLVALLAAAFWLGGHAAAAGRAPFSTSETLESLLRRGELTLTETHADGTLKQATAIAVIHAPAQAIWDRLVDYGAYKGWMPKVGEMVMIDATPGDQRVQWDVEVPGPNYKYVMRSQESQGEWFIQQEQVEGSLKGSRWQWQLVPRGEKETLVFRSAYTNVTDESWIAKQLDDSAHTLSFGVNVTSCLVEIRALRTAAEKAAR